LLCCYSPTAESTCAALSVEPILSEEPQRLEPIYQHKVAALEDLKNSLLHRVFDGEI
jgi:type I restriction enzyme S subunit